HSVRCVHASSVSAVSRYGSGINPSASRSRWVLPGTWAGIVRSAMFSGTGPEVARMRQPSWRVWWIILSSPGCGEHSWAKTSKVRVAPRAWTDHPEDSYLSELSKSRKVGSSPARPQKTEMVAIRAGRLSWGYAWRILRRNPVDVTQRVPT